MQTRARIGLVALVATIAATHSARADEGGTSVVIDPNLSHGDWAERVTIEVPPAARGVAPEVALVAAHRSGQSEVGAGWRLVASSAIRRRSPDNGVPATTPDAWDLDKSLFLVDGMELVPVEAPGSAHYQPELYDGSRYDYEGWNNTWVRRRNGWTWTYGGSTNTTRNVHTLPDPIPACTAPCNTETWFLASAVDPFGNRIDFTYEVAGIPAGMQGIYSSDSTKDHLVKTITYGGGSAVVTFTYGVRPDVTVDLSGGFPVIHSKRLTQITSSAGYSNYVLQYEDQYGNDLTIGTRTDCDNVPVAPPDEPTKRSLLRKVHQTTGGSNALTTLVRCNRYHHEAISWGTTSLSTAIPSPYANLEPLEDTVTPIAAELDGDGRTDLVLLSYTTEGNDAAPHAVYISTPDRTVPFSGSTAGGSAGIAAAAWQSVLRSSVQENVFANRWGRALVDITGDSVAELLVDNDGSAVIRTSVAGRAQDGSLTSLTFVEVDDELDGCDLRFGDFGDIDGDHRTDLIVHAHGAVGDCSALTESWWIRNLGEEPWFDSSAKQPLFVPTELGAAPGWDDALDACPNDAVGVPIDFNPDWTAAGYVADHARYADYNDDGLTDVAIALYACWDVDYEVERYVAVEDSAYSRMFFGNGKGGFVDSGLSAGPPVLLEPSDWDVDPIENTRMSIGMLGAIDFDRDGRSELLQTSAVHPGHLSFGFTEIESVDPSTGGFGVAIDALVGSFVGESYAAWPCSEVAKGIAFGDFDGDGFLDRVVTEGGINSWDISLDSSNRSASEGRLVESDNEHGGRTRLTWGFTAQQPNRNPELPANLEVLQGISGPGGARTLGYHGGVRRGDRFPFAEIAVTNDGGNTEVYSFAITSWAFEGQTLGVRYRPDGTVEHVSVFIQGQRDPTTVYIDTGAPYFNPLLRRCEYDVGRHAVVLADLEAQCAQVGWLAPAVVQTGGLDLDDAIPLTANSRDFLLGRRWTPIDDTERAQLSRLYRARGGRSAPPRGGRMSAPTIDATIDEILQEADPPVVDSYYRWPIPAALFGAIPDVETEEAAAQPPTAIAPGAPDGYAWDFTYDHPVHELVSRYEHRDLSTVDDDVMVRYESERVSPAGPPLSGDWYRVVAETSTNHIGTRLARRELSTFSGFDTPGEIRACGRSTPADCVTHRYEYFPNGMLKLHRFPDLTIESWTRQAGCGEPLTHTDAAGEVSTYTRDTKCLTQTFRRSGALWTYTYDGLRRPTKLVIAPGGGVNSTATITRTFYYDDALTFRAEVAAREDWSYTEPRRAERRSDGQLVLVHVDGLGRTTKRVQCTDTGTNATGGAIGLVACSSVGRRTLEWTLFGADGYAKVATAPFDAGETPVTTGVGHDGQGRAIAVMEPEHAPGSPAWRVDTIEYGAGYETRVEPTATATIATRRDHTTLAESLTVGGVARGSLVRNALGLVTSVTEADGAITRIDYDGRWQLERELRVDAAGQPVRAPCVMPDGTTEQRLLDHSITGRDLRGRVVEEVLPDDTVLGYAYDNVDRLLRRDVNGVPVQSFSYISSTTNAKGTVRVTDELGGAAAVSRIDGLGRSWLDTAPRVSATSRYDTTGRLASVTDIDGLITTIGYDLHDDVVAVTTPRTGTTTFDHDGAGKIISQTDADGVVDSHAYTYSGLPYQHHRGPFLVAERAYDPRGLPTATLDHGVASEMTYDDLGRLLSLREGVDGTTALRTTSWAYDTGDRVIETRRSPVAGVQTATTYTHHDAWGRAWETIDALNNATQLAFDAGGRVRRVLDAEGATLETQYDELGRVVAQQRPGAGWEHYEYTGRQTYGGEGDLWRIATYDDEDAARDVRTERFVDGTGNLLAELHRDGTTREWIRPTGRVQREQLLDASGAVYQATHYAYDAVTGSLLSATQGPYTATYHYTAAGRHDRTTTPDDVLERRYEHGAIERTLEAGVAHRYGRDPDTGWVITEDVQVGNGALRFAEIAHDKLGRRTRVEWSDGAGPTTVQTFALRDHYGNAWLETNTWGSGGALTAIEASTFDALGRPLTRTTSGAGLPARTTEWSWLDNGALAGVTTPGSYELRYDYGAAFDHQLDRVALDGTVIARIDARDLRGAVTSMTMPTTNQTRTTIYDDSARPVTRTTGPLPPVIDYEWNAAYHPDGRLAVETIEDYLGGAGWTNEYDYDAAGRLTREVVGKSNTTIEYALDAAGNRTGTRTTPPAGPATVAPAQYAGPKLVSVGGTALAYNAWNEVSTDHHGNSYVRSADGLVTGIANGGAATAFARDARGMPVAALEPGLLTRRTTWGLSPNGLPLEVEEGNGTILTYIEVEGVHVGTARNGQMVGVDADDRDTPLRHGVGMLGGATAFGDGVVPPSGGSDERFLYAMLERIPTAGAVMLSRLRTYDPTIGRFLEPDPIGSAGGLELFQYGLGDPVNTVDPMGTSGTASDCVNGGFSVALGKAPDDLSFLQKQAAEAANFTDAWTTFENQWAQAAYVRGQISFWTPVFTLDGEPPDNFPAPTGPMCVVNCGKKTTPDADEDPLEIVVYGESLPDSQDGGGDVDVDVDVDGDGDDDGGRDDDDEDEDEDEDEDDYLLPLASVALGRELHDRFEGFVARVERLPMDIETAAGDTWESAQADPVRFAGTLAGNMVWEATFGTIQDVDEGIAETLGGIALLTGAVVDVYSADDATEAGQAAEDFLDAIDWLGSGFTKVSGPLGGRAIATGAWRALRQVQRRGITLQKLDEVANHIGKLEGPIKEAQNPVAITLSLDPDGQLGGRVTTRRGRPSAEQVEYAENELGVQLERGHGGKREEWEHAEVVGIEQEIAAGNTPFAQSCNLCNCNQCAGVLQTNDIVSATPAQGAGTLKKKP
jgi:RHS repeat-associated protein